MRYEEALPKEFEQERARCPVCYLPWGALEWHGHHLALGNDALKAHEICLRIAEQVGGVVVPPVWVGAQTMQLYGLPLTLDFSYDVVRSLASEYLRELEKAGFLLTIVLAGHYGKQHMATLAEAVTQFTAEHQMAVWVLPDYEPVTDLGYRGDHAAKWETSILMHLRPELVDMNRLPADPSEELEGVGGEDPREHASPETGDAIVAEIVNRLAGRVQEFLQEKRGGAEPLR